MKKNPNKDKYKKRREKRKNKIKLVKEKAKEKLADYNFQIDDEITVVQLVESSTDFNEKERRKNLFEQGFSTSFIDTIIRIEKNMNRPKIQK